MDQIKLERAAGHMVVLLLVETSFAFSKVDTIERHKPRETDSREICEVGVKHRQRSKP